MNRFLLPLGVCSLLVAGCGRVAGPTPADPPPADLPAWTDDMQAVADGNNRFALDLYAKLREAEKGNLFFSPYSAHTALTMAATGARGTTRDEMAKVLHLPADADKALASGDVGRFYAHPRPDYELSVANALWGQKGFPWRPEFLNVQKERFGAGFREADFAADPDGERRRVNDWAEEQTRGRVKELLREGLVTPNTRMVLANAISFKGEWRGKFDPGSTRPRPFTLADGTKVTVPMMRRTGGFRRHIEFGAGGFEAPDLQVAELPYKGDELSMVVLLPGTHEGLPALEAKLSPAALAGWLAKASDEDRADLNLPRFRIETLAMMLKAPLRKLGMVAAFDEAAADFTGMHSGSERLFVGAVVQKAFVDVSEEGTEAAAATAVGITKKAEPLDFRADHPFLFLIRDVKRGTILFMGRVTNPNS